MRNKIRVLDIVHQTTVDGPGLRTAIYCAGCAHRCPGCHNPQSWHFGAGDWMSVDSLLKIIKDDDLSDVTFTGGDPFYQVEAFTALAKKIKRETDKTIWCWTGFTIEQIRASSHLSRLLEYIDVLVDGPYVEALRTTDLPWRGSSNQRVLFLNPAEEEKQRSFGL